MDLYIYPKDLSEAEKIQRKLSSKVILEDKFGDVSLIAGVDVGYKKSEWARAAVVVLSYPDLELLEWKVANCKVEFPYISGFLSFREIPSIIKAIKKLNLKPDLILCDGQGIAHPRGMGIATHLGIILDIPTIGVAKKRLVGTFKIPNDKKGAWEPLYYKGEIVGAVLRTRKGIKPVFVSSGYKISLTSAIDWVMRSTIKYKLPEPIRKAHHLSITDL